MKNKCKKYEQLFLFAGEEEFQQHIETCPECKEYHEKMMRVASLVKEAEPLIKKSGNNKVALKAVAAVVTIFMVSFAVIPMLHQQTVDTDLLSMKDISPVAQMGLPTDDYGLLVIE